MTVYQSSVPPWRRDHSAAIPPQARRHRSKSQAGEWILFIFLTAIFASLVHGAIK
jgi:hypothetical protein